MNQEKPEIWPDAPVRGILFGLALSIPIWCAIILGIAAFF